MGIVHKPPSVERKHSRMQPFSCVDAAQKKKRSGAARQNATPKRPQAKRQKRHDFQPSINKEDRGAFVAGSAQVAQPVTSAQVLEPKLPAETEPSHRPTIEDTATPLTLTDTLNISSVGSPRPIGATLYTIDEMPANTVWPEESSIDSKQALTTAEELQGRRLMLSFQPEKMDSHLAHSSRAETRQEESRTGGPSCLTAFRSSKMNAFEAWASRSFVAGPMATISLPERVLDSSRPNDTFSSEDVRDIKRAADFLFALSCFEQAFDLYVILLKLLKDSNEPAWMTSWVMTSCWIAAETESQDEVARSLRRQECRKQQGSGSRGPFLQMIQTYALGGLRFNKKISTEFKRHAKAFLKSPSPVEKQKIFSFLPEGDRSIDLLAYNCMMECLGHLDTLRKQKEMPLPFPQIDKVPAKVEAQTIQEAILTRCPGPFELHNGTMGNPCIRSCLRWCIHTLESTHMIPHGPWRDLQFDHCTAMMAEWYELCLYLWGRWQQGRNRGTVADSELMLWTVEAERLMGISSAELLMLLCYEICRVTSQGRESEQTPDEDIAPRIRVGANALSLLSDQELGRRFLEDFSWRQVRFELPPTLMDFGSVGLEYAIEFIEDGLDVVLPEVQHYNLVNTINPHLISTFKRPKTRNRPRLSIPRVFRGWSLDEYLWPRRTEHTERNQKNPHIRVPPSGYMYSQQPRTAQKRSREPVASNIPQESPGGPPLAPSLQSSDLSMLRSLGGHIQRGVKRAIEDVSSSLSSRSPSSMMDISIRSLDGLSDSIFNSLKLYSKAIDSPYLQQNTVVDVLQTG